jgi:hypothetical protein
LWLARAYPASSSAGYRHVIMGPGTRYFININVDDAAGWTDRLGDDEGIEPCAATEVNDNLTLSLVSDVAIMPRYSRHTGEVFATVEGLPQLSPRFAPAGRFRS